jgi:hypothetical protein
MYRSKVADLVQAKTSPSRVSSVRDAEQLKGYLAYKKANFPTILLQAYA